MTKRQKLDYNSEELTQNLKTSTGLGMNAFFTPSSPPPPTASTRNKKLIKKAEMRQASKRTRTQQPVKSSMPTTPTRHPSTQTRTDAFVHARVIDELRRLILSKKHLSSFTFRFKSEELEILDNIYEELNRQLTRQRVSKNDIVRLSLNWLFQDYQKNKHASVLARVLTQV